MPDDHALEVLLAQEQRIDAPFIPEQGPDLISGVVTMDDATFDTLLSLHSGVSTTSRFNASPYWTQDRLNPSSIKELLIKWSPRALLTRLASDPHVEWFRIPTVARHSPTGQNDRPVHPQRHTVRVPCSLDVHCTQRDYAVPPPARPR